MFTLEEGTLLGRMLRFIKWIVILLLVGAAWYFGRRLVR